MNMIDTSFSYSVHNGSPGAESQNQSPLSPRNSRFEIQFDQANKNKYNSPLNARLMYYRNSQQSLRGAQYSQSAGTSPLQSPRNSMIQTTAFFPSQQQQVQQEQQQSHVTPTRPKAPPLLRSTSLPTIQKNKHGQSHELVEDYRIRSSRVRKSSILTNCTHVSDGMDQDHPDPSQRNNSIDSHQERSNSIISTSSNHSCDHKHHHSQGDLCKRHHHRRESIAIKFNNPQVINDDTDNDIPIVGDTPSPQQSQVFEKLQNYELK